MMAMTTNTMMRTTMMMMVIAKTLQQAATFDTMWHSTMPQVASLYALKLAWEKEHGVRRCKMQYYHFVGTSSCKKIHTQLNLPQVRVPRAESQICG